ncbi:MAG: RNA polymerase sigma factor [Polyangiaceae bacterium]
MHPRPVAPDEDSTTPVPVRPDFAAIFRTEFSYVWNALGRLGVDPSDREDVAHDVFHQVYRRLDDYDPARPLRPWLFGFAFRLASDHRRQARKRYELIGIDVEHFAGPPRPDDELSSAEERAIAEAALRVVALERRAILILHEIDGESVPTIATALEIPLNTAYSRLRLARAEFATAVRKIRAEEGRHAAR